MPDHVTPEQIRQYRGKTLASSDLLAFDRHVARCETCRVQIADPQQVSRVLSDLASAQPEHISYDEMVQYVEGTAAALDREAVESHVDMCVRCKAELQDLSSFASEMAASGPRTLASEAPGLGAISFSKAELRAMLPIEQEKGKKDQ